MSVMIVSFGTNSFLLVTSLTENVLGGSAEASHLIAESVYILVELCTC